MDVNGTPQPPARRISRALLVVTLAASILGTATVLARPHLRASGPQTAVRVDVPFRSVAFHEANAGLDVGPGSAESELAILPEARR